MSKAEVAYIMHFNDEANIRCFIYFLIKLEVACKDDAFDFFEKGSITIRSGHRGKMTRRHYS